MLVPLWSVLQCGQFFPLTTTHGVLMLLLRRPNQTKIGDTHHITSDHDNLSLHSEYTRPDQLRNGNGTGLWFVLTLYFFLSFSLKDIFHLPQISKNLFYVSKFTSDHDVFFEFRPTFFLVKDRSTGKVVLHGTNKKWLYCLDQSQHSSSSEPFAFLCEWATMEIWHQRLGHLMLRKVTSIIALHSLPISNESFNFRQSCHMSKSHRLAFPFSTTIYNNPLELLVSNIWNPGPIVSNNGSRYCIIFMDVFSCYIWLFPLAK